MPFKSSISQTQSNWLKFLFPYWPKRFFTTTSFVVLMALMLALRVVLQFFAIPLPVFGLRISIAWLPVYVMGFLFGPLVGLVFGAVSDTLSFLLFGGVWFWMYAIQEPVVGCLAGICGSCYFIYQHHERHHWSFQVIWRCLLYGFSVFCFLNLLLKLDLIEAGAFQGGKNMTNELALAITVCVLQVIFIGLLETLNQLFRKKYRKYARLQQLQLLFIFVMMAVIINVMLFSFILGPTITLAYWEYIGMAQPNGFIEHGVFYLLIPRILKECIKTPLYILLLFAILWALKKQYTNLINNARNKWDHHPAYTTIQTLKQELKDWPLTRLEKQLVLYIATHHEVTLATLNQHFKKDCHLALQTIVSYQIILTHAQKGVYYYTLNPAYHTFMPVLEATHSESSNESF